MFSSLLAQREADQNPIRVGIIGAGKFGAGLVALLVMLLGTIAFFVGIFLAIPVVTIAAAHIYLQLRGEPIAE